MSTIGRKLGKLFGKAEERHYHIHGQIVFNFTPAGERYECPPELAIKLQEAIKTADREHPWKDANDYTGEELPSIRYLGNAENQYNNWGVPELNVWFHLYPGAEYVRKSQLFAYEKYLENLAEVLFSRLEEWGATSVRSAFSCGSTSKRFK